MKTTIQDFIVMCPIQHQAFDFDRYLNECERHNPKCPNFKNILDVSKNPFIGGWCARRTQWRINLPPTDSSLFEMVKRLIAEVVERQIERGIHRFTPKNSACSFKLRQVTQYNYPSLQLSSIR